MAYLLKFFSFVIDNKNYLFCFCYEILKKKKCLNRKLRIEQILITENKERYTVINNKFH